MPSPSMLRAVAALAPGRRVTVTAGRQSFELPIAPPAPAVEPPHPLEAVSKQLLERDAETRATVATVAEAVERIRDTANAVKVAVADVAASQELVAQSVTELSGTLHLPVKPIYDKAGKLIGAERVRKL